MTQQTKVVMFKFAGAELTSTARKLDQRAELPSSELVDKIKFSAVGISRIKSR